MAFFSLKKAKGRPYCCPRVSHGGLRGDGGRPSSETCAVGMRGNGNAEYWETCFHRKEGNQTLGCVHRAPAPKAHLQRCSEAVGQGPRHPDLFGLAWSRG